MKLFIKAFKAAVLFNFSYSRFKKSLFKSAAVAAADAADRAARTAIQIHGAMGYSWEVDLQFYAKRAWALAGLNGGRARHFRTVYDSLLGGRGALGPDHLFSLPQHSPLAARGDPRA